jgi:hypothetical protein
MDLKKKFSLLFIVICLLNLNSCILFVPYAVNQSATYSESFDYSVKDVSHAVLDQFKNNKNIKITKNIITDQESVINGDVDSKKYKGSFKIRVVKLTQSSSRLQIKYDIFGDKVRSEEFLENVRDDLNHNY